jgi:hypothetical protein
MPSKPNEDANRVYADFDNSGSAAEPTAASKALQKTAADRMMGVDEDAAAIEEGSNRRMQVDYSTEIDESDIGKLRMKLGQPGTPEVKAGQAKAGQFIIPGFPAFDSVTVSPLRWGRSRDYAVGRPLISLCSSANGRIGIGDNGTGEGKHECKTCAKNVWRKNPNPTVKTNLPPECSEQFNFVMFVAELGLPVEYRMQKTGLKVGENIVAVCQAQGFGGFLTRLTSLPKTSSASPEGFVVPVSTYVPEPDEAKDPTGYKRHQAILQAAQACIVSGTLPDKLTLDPSTDPDVDPI